jgi:5-methylcytosine-specific restriction endonuclease McrA
MDLYFLRHKRNDLLLQDLSDLVAGDFRSKALIVAHIAEVDRRKLYLQVGYPSMYLYCVEALHLSEPAAYKRIHAARAARKCPEIFVALADGRVNLSAICLLAPYMTRRNGAALLAEATHRRRFEIKEMLARHFPQPDRLAVDPEIRPVQASTPAMAGFALAPEALGVASAPTGAIQAPAAVVSLLDAAPSPGLLGASQTPAPVFEARHPAPLAPDRYELRFEINNDTHELLKRAQDLLSPSVPSGSIPEIFRRSLVALIAQTEKRKAAVGCKPRRPRGAELTRRSEARRRHVPAQERRTVWERDGGRCTGVSETGRRCEERRFLEFDHVIPVARGGRSTADNLRLRCREHNQYEAERIFGAEFMKRKRSQARRGADVKPGAMKGSGERETESDDSEWSIRPKPTAPGASSRERPDETLDGPPEEPSDEPSDETSDELSDELLGDPSANDQDVGTG